MAMLGKSGLRSHRREDPGGGPAALASTGQQSDVSQRLEIAFARVATMNLHTLSHRRTGWLKGAIYQNQRRAGLG